MKFLFRTLWLGSVATVCVLFLFTQKAWLDRATYVTNLAGGPDLKQVSPSATGAALNASARSLIIPEHNESSYHWLLQGEQAAIHQRWTVGTVDYDNAPVGRSVTAPSPYRWWLTLLAFGDRTFFRHSYSVSFERAALIADPLLLFFGVGVLVALVHRSLGAKASAVLAVGGFTFFPFASAFLPAAPDVRGLVALLVLWSVVLLVIGLRSPKKESGSQQESCGRAHNGWFIAAGIASALVSWIHLATGLALIAATFVGALAARVWSGRIPDTESGVTRAWRGWALAGGSTMLLAYLLDYVPRGVGLLRLDQVSPCYALAWSCSVELLVTQSWRAQEGHAQSSVHRWVILLLTAAPLLALGWLLGTGAATLPGKDLLWAKLTNLPGGSVAANSWTWLRSEHRSGLAWGTMLPLVIVPMAAWCIWPRLTDSFGRGLLCVPLAITAVFVVIAARQLGAWSNLDAVLIAFAVGAVSREKFSPRWIDRIAIFGVILASGAVGLSLLRLPEPVGPKMAITAAETTQLVERDLADWLNDRFGEKGITVFAPPRETTALCYFGGFKGIGTFAPENRAGFGTALSIVGAATMEEVEALVHARGIRCIVLPSWDPFLEDFARLYLSENYSNRSSLLVHELRSWNLPLWLRPMAYQMPAIPGFEKQGVLVFEVVEPQTPALAASRTAECLAELGDLPRAKQISESLRRFPGDVGALAARVNVAIACDDAFSREEAAGLLRTRVQTHADRYLAWDRRVSLAVALAQANALDLAKVQIAKCLSDADEKKLRALSTSSLFRLLVLAKTFELHFAEARWGELAERLLPANVRAQL